MSTRFKRPADWLITACCCVMLVATLAACDSGSTTQATPTPAPKPSSEPTLLPTPSPTFIPTQSATAAGVYTGNGFSIHYPQGWITSRGGNGTAVTISDPSQLDTMTIVVTPDPNGLASADRTSTMATNNVRATMTNPQMLPVPATVTIGGDKWIQKSVSGTVAVAVVQLVILADNHPPNTLNTLNFTIVYGTNQAAFAGAVTSDFQPMLNSFKFGS